MRLLPKMLFLALLGFTACQKQNDLVEIAQNSATAVDDRSGGSGNGGGNNNNQGLIAAAIPLDPKLISGHSTDIGVVFTQPAPAGGWTITITSNDPALQVPATFFVPEGVSQVHPVVTSSAVSNAKIVTYTVKLGTQTKSNTIKIFPATATFPPPVLSKPGNGSKFNFGLNILFDWTDNNNAWYYQFQVSWSTTFDPLWFEIGFPDSFYTTNYFASGKTHYWRVRSVDASGNPGPWSEVRNFFVKPQ